jgi:enoyl-[acyl-carrier protein] reductase I
MLGIDLTGQRALVAGVADDKGYGWSIACALARAGASICAGTWPPALGIFTKSLERGKLETDLGNGRTLTFEKVYPLDAIYDEASSVPAEVREDKRYRETGGFTIGDVADRLMADWGKPCLDVVVHSLANGHEVQRPLIETSRAGYLAAVSASAYSMVALVQRFAPLMRQGGAFLCLSYLAAERVIPGYGGGMSSAKAALESDVRTLAYEAGRRFGVRVNAISAGPLASRAARAIGMIDKSIEHYGANSALGGVQSAEDVGHAAAFLCSRLAAGITGEVLYVDRGYHIMGSPAEVQ